MIKPVLFIVIAATLESTRAVAAPCTVHRAPEPPNCRRELRRLGVRLER